MPRIRIEAPAKLNLNLHVGAVRSDGYHDIDGIFLALAFGDTLVFETSVSVKSEDLTDSPVSIAMNWQFPAKKTAVLDLPPEKNIIFRAISLFRMRTGYDRGLKIDVEKRIPAGGGLGGGSSDAAATLLALNRLILSEGGSPVSGETLSEMGAALGSDVPFFLNIAAESGGSDAGKYTCVARVSGRGEQVQLIAMPENYSDLSFVLVNPGFPSDTASAFRQLSCMRKAFVLNAPMDETFSDAEYLSLLSAPPHNWPFVNDFLPAFETDNTNGANSFRNAGTVYREILTVLKETGAEFTNLSGSGSTCFGVFTSRAGAAAAKEHLLRRWPCVIETFPLARRAIPYYN